MYGIVSKVVRRFFPRDIRTSADPRSVPASQQPLRSFSFPALEQRDVENARLFARREDLIHYFAPRLAGGTVAELGVMYGDFSDFILRTVEPALFVAIDLFEMHNMPVIWCNFLCESLVAPSIHEIK